jgi:hypothetical protein
MEPIGPKKLRMRLHPWFCRYYKRTAAIVDAAKKDDLKNSRELLRRGGEDSRQWPSSSPAWIERRFDSIEPVTIVGGFAIGPGVLPAFRLYICI